MKVYDYYMIFEDRQDAGRQLAKKLLHYKNRDVVVVSLLRGGVPVGFEIAKALHAPHSVLSVRKIGAPFNSEFAIGAIAPGGVRFMNEELIHRLGISDEQINAIIVREEGELDRREKSYGYSINLENKIVILTDDGIATGLTAKAAIAAIRKEGARIIVLAIPCCPSEIVKVFTNLVDDFVSLEIRDDFGAVGELYKHFDQVSDEELSNVLKK